MDEQRDALLRAEQARWDAEAADRYDTPGRGMFDPGLLAATCAFLKERAAGGAALEFAIGTGRVALPLSALGVPVSGIDLSPHMLARLRAKPSAQVIPHLQGDMCVTRMPGDFSLVYLVFNSLSNLLTEGMQRECSLNAARHVRPGGRFMVELWVPRLPGEGIAATVFASEPGYIGLDTFDLSRQRVCSRHFYFGEGPEARLFRSEHRYLLPPEMDDMARGAGFRLEARYADWQGTPLSDEAASQIAVYRLEGP